MTTHPWTGLCASCLLVLAPAHAAETRSETGVVVVTSTTGSSVNYVGIPVAPPPAVGGTLTGVSPATPSVSALDDDWSGLASNASGPWFVEIASGPAAGWWSRVVTLDVTARTATLAATTPGNLGVGARYQLRRALTVGGLFGGDNAARFAGGESPSEGDQIIVVDAASQAQKTFFYSTVSGHTGWHDAAYASADDAPVWPGQGVIVRRRSTGTREIALAGTSRAEAIRVRLEPGVNVVGHQIPGTVLTLESSGLVAAGLQGGASAAAADQVLVPQSDGSLVSYYYSTASGDIGWKRADGSAATGVSWSSEGVLLIKRQSAPALEWQPPEVP